MITIRIDGAEVELPRDERVSLIDFVRERLHLHGTKGSLGNYIGL